MHWVSQGADGVRATAPHTHPGAPQNVLHHSYSVEVPVKFLAGRLWVRISSHVYNTLADYERLADAVLELAASC